MHGRDFVDGAGLWRVDVGRGESGAEGGLTSQDRLLQSVTVSNVVRLNAGAYDFLVEVRDKHNLATLSDAVLWFKREGDLDELRRRVDLLEKQYAHLLEQVGSAGEGNSTRD